MQLSVLPAVPDRRRGLRTEMVAMRATCSGFGFACRYDVRDLSHSGALITGPQFPPLGSLVAVSMDNPTGAGSIAMCARVARHVAEADAVAIAFESLTTDAEDFVHDSIVLELARERSQLICVVSPEALIARGLVESLTHIGCRAMSVQTPLGMITALGSRVTPVATVVVDTLALDFEGFELAQVAAETFPKIRRLLLGGRSSSWERVCLQRNHHADEWFTKDYSLAMLRRRFARESRTGRASTPN